MGFESNNIDQGVLLLLNKKLKALQAEVDALSHGGGGAVSSVNGQTGDVVLEKADVGLGSVDNIKQYSATNPPPYPVTSVNGQTGAVAIAVPTKTSDLDNDSGFVDSAGAAAAAPVKSVNGKTGAVSLTASDVGALPDNTPIPSGITWYSVLGSTTLTTSYVEKATYNSRKFSDYMLLNFVCWRGSWVVGTATVPYGRFVDATGLALVFQWGSESIEYDVKYVDDTHVQVKKITSSSATIQLQIHGFTIA